MWHASPPACCEKSHQATAAIWRRGWIGRHLVLSALLEGGSTGTYSVLFFASPGLPLDLASGPCWLVFFFFLSCLSSHRTRCGQVTPAGPSCVMSPPMALLSRSWVLSDYSARPSRRQDPVARKRSSPADNNVSRMVVWVPLLCGMYLCLAYVPNSRRRRNLEARTPGGDRPLHSKPTRPLASLVEFPIFGGRRGQRCRRGSGLGWAGITQVSLCFVTRHQVGELLLLLVRVVV